MKNIGFLLLALLFSTFLTKNLFAQSPVEKVSQTLQSNNISDLTNKFANSVQLILLEEDYNATKVDATQLVQDFFQKMDLKGFQLKHNGSAPDGSQFAIGNMKGKEGSYRIYFVMKEDQIHEFCVETD